MTSEGEAGSDVAGNEGSKGVDQNESREVAICRRADASCCASDPACAARCAFATERSCCSIDDGVEDDGLTAAGGRELGVCDTGAAAVGVGAGAACGFDAVSPGADGVLAGAVGVLG